MNALSTSFERAPGELFKFGIGSLGALLGVCGIIFARPILGLFGAVMLLLILASHWQSPSD